MRYYDTALEWLHRIPRQRSLVAKERYHFLRVIRLLRTPEDVIDFEVLSRKADEFGDGHLPARFRITMLVVAVLHGDTGGNTA